MRSDKSTRISCAGMAGCVALIVATAGAQPVAVQVDEQASFIELTLDVSGFTDTDSSAVGGTITVDPVDPNFPDDLLVYGYNLALLDDLNLTLGGGFLGSLLIDFIDLTVVDDFQGQVFAAPVIDNQFTLIDAPSVLGGILTYNASGLFCITLGSFDLPCQASQDLADQGTVFLTFTGEVEVVDNMVTLSAAIDATAPLDPENPGLGTITVTGQIIGSAELPATPICIGDLDGNGQVDAGDLGILLAAFGNSAAGDLTGNGITDASDLGVLLAVFGNVCE